MSWELGRAGLTGSIHFEDAGGLHDRRPLLACGKAGGPLAVNIDPGEFFAVGVINGDLPVAVLPAAVVAESGTAFRLANSRFLFQEETSRSGSIPASASARKSQIDYPSVRYAWGRQWQG
jgi:hypothetical protein